MKPRMFNKSEMHAAGRSVLLTTTLVFCHAAPSAFAATGTWANSTTAAGNWSDTTKWVGGIVPTAAGDTANFNADYGTNNKVITIDTTSRTVGTLNIGDPGVSYRSVTVQASGGASLNFDNSGGGALLSRTTNQNGGSAVTDVISAPVTLADNLTVNMTDTNSGTALAITGVISESGGARSMTKNGSGILQFGSASAFPVNTFTGGFTLNAGEVQFFVSSVLGTGTLTINGGSLAARGAPRLPGNNVVVGGDFTLNSANAGGNLLTLTGAVDLGGSTRTITVDATGGAAISGSVSNGGLAKAGTRTLTLSGTNTYSGSTSVNAGTLALSGTISGSSVTVASGGTFSSPSGTIEGSGSFTSSGTATLEGTNNYTGATIVNGGTTAVKDLPSSSSVNVDGSGAKFTVVGYGTVSSPVTLTQGTVDGLGKINTLVVANAIGNTLSAGNGVDDYLELDSLTFNGEATLNVRGNSDLSGQYYLTDSLATSGPSTKVVVNATNSAGIWSSGVDYTVIDYTSYPVGDASHFQLGAVSGLLGIQNAALINTGSAIVLRITSDALVWSGAQNANWTTAAIGGAKNWTFQGTGTEYTNGSAVRFQDGATNLGVNLAENVSPGAIVVDNSFNDYSISSTGSFGILTGSLVKSGGGKLTINTNNSFTGATSIFAGTLEVNGSGSISSSSSITNNGSLVLGPVVSQVYGNPISGTGSVTKQGAGTLTLSGSNTFTGGFTLESGTLNFNSTSALGQGPGAFVLNGGSLNNSSGGDLVSTSNKPQTWNTDLAFAGTNSLDMGSGTVTLGGVSPDLTVTVSANTFTVGEMKSTTQGLVKQGAGTLVLTSIGAGNAASVVGGVLNVSTGAIQFNRTNADASGSGDLTTAGLTGSGSVINGAGVERWFFVNPTGSSVFGGSLSNGGSGALGLIKGGIGTQTLTGASTYTGPTTVNAGLLNVQNGAALGGSTVSVRNIAAGLQLQGGITVPNNFLTSNDGSGATGYAIANVSGDNTITGTISLRDGGGQTVILSDTGSLTLAGNVSEADPQNGASVLAMEVEVQGC